MSLFVAGVAVLVVLLVALRRMVLRPVSRLTQHAVRIAEGDDLTQRMNVRRADEIGVLAREFDRMVDKLADARRRLVDQSFEAGASQAASGVLHNIGNAMTPLSVTVATLQERLRSAPAGRSRWCWRRSNRAKAIPRVVPTWSSSCGWPPRTGQRRSGGQ